MLIDLVVLSIVLALLFVCYSIFLRGAVAGAVGWPRTVFYVLYVKGAEFQWIPVSRSDLRSGGMERDKNLCVTIPVKRECVRLSLVRGRVLSDVT